MINIKNINKEKKYLINKIEEIQLIKQKLIKNPTKIIDEKIIEINKSLDDKNLGKSMRNHLEKYKKEIEENEELFTQKELEKLVKQEVELNKKRVEDG